MKDRVAGLVGVLALFAVACPAVAATAEQESSDRAKVFQAVDPRGIYPQGEVAAAGREPESATEKTEDKYRAHLGKHLLPGGSTLVWRSLKFTFGYQDQSDNVVGVTGMEPDQMLEVRPNPETRLRQLTATLTPARWFRSAADFKAAYDLAARSPTQGLVDAKGPKDPLECLAGSEPGDKLDFLAWTGKDRFLRRFALGLSVELGLSERGRDPGTPLPPKDRDTVWTFKFDPDALSVFPGDLAAAYEALAAHTALDVGNLANLANLKPVKEVRFGDHGNPIDYLNTLTGRTVRGRWLAALVPSFEYKRASQFDFSQVNGAFVSSPIEDTLDTWTVTWDLGATLDTAKHRREAVTAIALHKQLLEQDMMRTEKELIILGDSPDPIEEGEVLYHPLSAWQRDKETGKAERAKSITWSGHVGGGEKGSPLDELNLTLTSDGALVGKPDRSANGRTITITATDPYKKKTRHPVTLSVGERSEEKEPDPA